MVVSIILSRATIRTHLLEVRKAFIPGPFIAAVLGPLIVCGTTSTQPGVVVQTTTSTQNLSSCVLGFMSLLALSVPEGDGVLPVIFAFHKLECQGGSRNLFFFEGVTASFSCDRKSAGGWGTNSLPASMTRMERLGFSAKRPATQLPAVPPLSSAACLLVHCISY